MSLLVYVSAPFEDDAVVRAVHDRLEDLHITPTSRWADYDMSASSFAKYAPTQLRQVAIQNDADLRGSDVVMVLARAGAGDEMFADARMAIEWKKAVVWVGKRRTLTAWRAGVVIVDDIDAGIKTLVRMREKHLDGYRGELLAHLAGAAA